MGLPSPPNSLLLFFTLINTLLIGNIRLFKFITKTHFFTLFNKKTPKNRYTRKQSRHFSMTPLRPELKKIFFRNLKILKFGLPKKMTPKSQAKIKPSFPQYPFLTIFNLKKVSCEEICDFKS